MARKIKTNEEKLAGWMADSNRGTCNYSTLIELGWEAGQVAYIECYGMRYERFDLPNGEFVVVEWNAEGDVTVA